MVTKCDDNRQPTTDDDDDDDRVNIEQSASGRLEGRVLQLKQNFEFDFPTCFLRNCCHFRLNHNASIQP